MQITIAPTELHTVVGKFQGSTLLSGAERYEPVVRRMLAECPWINGNTPFQVYRDVLAVRHAPVIVITDADRLLRGRVGIKLLNQLCETEPVKTVGWHTQATMKDDGPPSSFRTAARLVVIARNQVNPQRRLAGLIDRCLFVSIR